jgi:hypothetical protein
MTNLQTQKLRMYLTVQVLLKANLEVLAKMPNGAELLNQLETQIQLIQSNNIVQQQGTSALTQQKSVLRTTLITNTLDTSHKMQAYAAFVKDSALLEKVGINETDLKRLAEEELIVFAKSLYTTTNLYLSKIAAYGITDKTQATFLSSINGFDEGLPQIRKEKQDQKNITVLLGEEFDAADGVMDQLNLQVELVKESYPQFYADYKQLTKVRVTFKTVQLMAKVTDAASGDPVANVTLAFTLKDGTAPVMVKSTAEKGGAMIKSIEQGHYTVEVSKFGYQTQTLTIAVSSDEPYTLTVKLIKS